MRLTGPPCSTAVQLALLEAIQRAVADGRTVVIMPPAEVDPSEWRWECVDTLLDAAEARAPGGKPQNRSADDVMIRPDAGSG